MMHRVMSNLVKNFECLWKKIFNLIYFKQCSSFVPAFLCTVDLKLHFCTVVKLVQLLCYLQRVLQLLFSD